MGANLINDKLRNQQHISESENLNKSTNKNPLYIVFSITDYYKKYNLKFHYWQRLLSIYTLLPYSFLPDSINNLFPNKHPSIHPRLLWIISSNSNNPLQSQSWLISIADDILVVVLLKPWFSSDLLLPSVSLHTVSRPGVSLCMSV